MNCPAPASPDGPNPLLLPLDTPPYYAAGNTAAPMSGQTYPGAGTPIGTGLAFSYRAVLDLEGRARG